ncbi:hypothetical protein [Rickettsia endosymbiont of Halotydeus destructor]|uniref:hypothetical protein n=1 Tax=Rickettsia endosymbiont of Halotydeus destructor TaxID=2996754 RepID=UPI003BB19C50
MDDLEIENRKKLSKRTKSRIKQVFDKIKSVWNSFKESKTGKILFSNSFSYALSLGGVAIALSGIFAPISPIIIAGASIAATGVGIQAVNETLKIHSLRKLQKENNLLVQNRNAKTTQDYILSLEPNLKNALKNALFMPQLKQKNPNKNKYNINSQKLSSTGRVLANNIGGVASIARNIIEGASGNVVAILKATGYGVLTTASLITGGLSEKEKNDIQKMFKLNINTEYQKQDTPNYKNLKQLEEFTKKQTLQTLALKKLITDKYYWKIKDVDKQEKFYEIEKEFKEEINKDGLKAFLAKKELNIDNNKVNYKRDFTRGLDPFYEKPTKAHEYTPLTEAMKAKPELINIKEEGNKISKKSNKIIVKNASKKNQKKKSNINSF